MHYSVGKQKLSRSFMRVDQGGTAYNRNGQIKGKQDSSILFSHTRHRTQHEGPEKMEGSVLTKKSSGGCVLGGSKQSPECLDGSKYDMTAGVDIGKSLRRASSSTKSKGGRRCTKEVRRQCRNMKQRREGFEKA